MYADEHGMPHFHVESPDGRCSISIETMDVIIGSVPPRILRAAMAWASEHRDELRSKWMEWNQ